MSPVLTRSRPAPVRFPRQVVAAGGTAILALALFAGLLDLVRGPDFVGHVTIENRAATELRVDVVDSDGELLGLAVADSHATARVDTILDPGGPWVFRVSRAGDTLATIRMTRDELAAKGWRLVLPEAIENEVIGRQ